MDKVCLISGQRPTCRSETGSSKSSTSSKISVEYISSVLEKLKNRQTRDSTAKTYISVWRHLNRFIISLDYKGGSLSWEEKTALFGAYLVDNGIQSATLKSYFSAIKHILKQDGYLWDDKKVLLSSLVRGCQLTNDKVKIRLPIQYKLLDVLLFELERFYSEQPYLELLYKTIFSLAYYGMLRIGEITQSPHCVKAKDVHVGHNKDKIMIVLYTSKTHGEESRPQKIKISDVTTQMNYNSYTKKFFCPFKLVIQYMSTRSSYITGKEQFFVFADGSPVKGDHFRTLLRKLLTAVNLDSMLYDVHSFRIGRTCDLYKFGYSIEQIKAMGRWKSNAVYRYLKN